MIDKQISNELKILALEMINNAGSGHSGSVLSCTDALYTLYTRHILTDGTKHILRDRFVLSNGHVCAALYSVLSGMGYLDFEEIKNFRKFGGLLTGHPEIEIQAVDCSTGPLGQGVADAVGMAIAETIMHEKFGCDHYTYCMFGDGCLQEGVAIEALSLAGLYKLNKLIFLYDKNDVTLDGNLEKSSSDDVVKKFKSMNLNVITCDGYDIEKIDKAIIKAKQSKEKPTVIILKTIIGKDTNLENNHKSHGAVYSIEEINKLKNKYKINNKFLQLSEETKNYLNNKKIEINAAFEERINVLNEFVVPNADLKKTKITEKIAIFNENLTKNKELLKKYNNFIKNEFKYKIKTIKEKLSTRDINNLILNELSKTNDNLVVLSADLSSSTKVKINDGGEYSAHNRLGKNIALGVREHSMGAIANGIALHGGLVPITSTFLVFSNYMMPAIRMAGIMNLPVIFTFSHSSAYDIADGITHVPVEQLDQLRLIPNISTFRVADSVETKAAYDWFYTNQKPMCLCVSKTATQPINAKEDMTGGAYYVTNEKASINIMASGTDVETALQLQFELKKENIIANVVSVISLEVFEKQNKQFKNKFLNKPLFVVETSTGVKYLKYTSEDKVFNITKFGISADSVNMRSYYGHDLQTLVNKIKKILK